MILKKNISSIKKGNKHKLEDVCILDNRTHLLTINNTESVGNHTDFNLTRKKKIKHLSSINVPINNYKIFKNSDIICNILSFLTFSERWKLKLLNKFFYAAFNTKYAWKILDFRFIDIDLFNSNFLNKYSKLFLNTFSLSLSINGNKNVEMTINLIVKHFKYLRDLRLYFRKKNTNFIYEGVHPVVSNILNCKIIKETKKDLYLAKNVFCGDADGNVIGDTSDHNSRNPIKSIKGIEECEKKNDIHDDDIFHECKDKCKNYKLCYNVKGKDKTPPNGVDKNIIPLKMIHSENNDNCNILSCEFIDSDFEFNEFCLENYYYEYIDSKNEMKDKIKMEELLQKYIKIIERKKIWKNKILKNHNNFENLERLIIDVEMKGEELLCFVGKIKNLKDIIISKLLYSNKLNRSQNIIIFTCFIEKIKQNNVRLIQLGLYFRHEYKPIDYLNIEKFRKILSERKEYVYDVNKEEGDELMYILQKNHLNSLYCLWSNDLFISFEMYEQIKKFNNLKIWILPGWRALSLAKQ